MPRRAVVRALVSVSIHARTRRATWNPSILWYPTSSFNPRPHTAGDLAAASSCALRFCFNPRPHTAGDHTTVRLRRSNYGFNPRPHTAGDAEQYEVDKVIAVSIHARTRRATRARCRCRLLMQLFQSTPAHGGRQGVSNQPDVETKVSIHARTRRATNCLTLIMTMKYVSIHARTRRATGVATVNFDATRSFNPRPHTAGDLNWRNKK